MNAATPPPAVGPSARVLENGRGGYSRRVAARLPPPGTLIERDAERASTCQFGIGESAYRNSKM